VTLIGIIAAIVILGLLGAAVLMLVSVGSLGSLQALNQGQAFFAAESGISAARNYIKTHPNWTTNSSLTITGIMGQATFNAGVNSNGVITSVGRQAEAQWTSIWKAGESLRALVVYRQNNQNDPRYRTYSSLKRLSDTSMTGLSVLNEVQWQKLAASPVTNTFLLGVQEDQQGVWAQTYANGAWGSNTLLNAAGQAPAEDARGFDIAYENLSGRGLAVYSIGTANPQYRLWISNQWTSAGSINVGATNPVQWIRLIAKPGSDEIMCLARWRNTTPKKANDRRNYSSAIVWNGSGWTNYIPLERGCDSEIAFESMDAAWSSNSALVVYINGATTAEQRRPKYRIFNTILNSWSAEMTNATQLSAAPYWIRTEYSADGSQAYACFLQSGKQLQGAYWNGSVWGGYTDFGILETADYRDFDIAWSSQANTLMVVYCLNNASAHSYMIETEGSSPVYGIIADSNDDGRWSVLQADPYSSEFYYIALDAARDVNLRRWTGAAWILISELEAGSDFDYLSIDMAFRRDSAQ